MLKIYGDKRSRAFRTQWLARELGIEHEIIDISPAAARAHAGLKEVNANSKVPAIDDDGFHLFESLAINLYLAKKHGKLYPDSDADEAQMWQWCFWVVTEIETEALAVLEGHSNGQVLARPLGVLDQALTGRDYILGEAFTVGDLNMAAIISWLRFGGFDLTPWPEVSAWLDRCTSRPAIRS